MKKLIVFVGSIVAIIAIFLVVFRVYTKSFSPQDKVAYKSDSVDIEVKYSRPYVKDRVIFGELVPYGKVWRTGANEATVLSISHDLKINGKELKAGSYSIFTIPGKNSWKVIFNNEIGQWGIDVFSQSANRDPEMDALILQVKPIYTSNVFNQFTIALEAMGDEVEMIMMWENTLIVVPFSVK
ncbi:DUF2911 domain-containing protein [Fulvivirga sediminis]|uniref:DUF2911 domain-containing protein n=1 Tax=Fulvivirga sediminis TaxID=2803949 RepID=A0A937F5X9_9BACT|nr:DUF2911 domain-containing protein [Fulvivirga sediminis]MBL3654703.1 DUF2911 domain-containing protein [Fulvivirga sediminis]